MLCSIIFHMSTYCSVNFLICKWFEIKYAGTNSSNYDNGRHLKLRFK